MSILSERLKQLREDKDLMQKEVASIINITTSAYGFYEQGKRVPPPEVLSKLADFYNVSTDYLLGRDSNSNFAHKITKRSPAVETIAAHLEEKAEDITPKKMKLLKSYIDTLFDDFED